MRQTHKGRSWVLGLCAVTLVTSVGFGQDKRRQATIDVADADADFAVQGEYTGEIETGEGKLNLGLQVIARGDGKFEAVGYHGGLPGDGWDGETKHAAKGETKDGVTTLVAEVGKAIIKDGVATITDPEGAEAGKLKRIVRKSPTLGKKPPANAIVLFDGTTPDNFKRGRMTEDGLLMQGVTSHKTFQSYSLHMEFLLSYMPYARGQGRSNSGTYLQGRYEVQILDSFGLQGRNNECGGIYEIKDPDLNMCFPPLSWQTYDIDFVAAKYGKDGKKTANARMTVRHNGVVVHNNVELPRATRASPLREGPTPGPVYIQDHSNPLRFRNIWVVAKADDDEKDFVSLFDGKTLNGWHKNPERIGHGTGGRWYVEDGAIVGEQDPPGSGNGGILLTDKKFGDFELRLEMKPDWGVCSGLFLRSNDKGQCFQMMVDYHDAGNIGHIYGEGTGGFNNRPFDINGKYDDDKKLVGLTSAPTEVKPPKAFTISGENWVKGWKINEWNSARVQVVGDPPNITTWINGQKVSEFNGSSFPDKRYDAKNVSTLLGTNGSIAVQVHGGTGWPKGAKCRWRNIRIRPLN